MLCLINLTLDIILFRETGLGVCVYKYTMTYIVQAVCALSTIQSFKANKFFVRP